MMTAFSIQRAARLTGLTKRQLEYWDEQDVIRPSIAEYGGRSEPRLYSFKDLIALKVAAALRPKWPPRRIRESIRQLEARGFDDPFVTLCWVVETGGNEALYIDPGTGVPMSGRMVSQIAEPMDLPLREIRTGLEASIGELSQRAQGQIAKVRQVGSEPVVVGTRVPAHKLARLAAAGWQVDQIVAAYPTVTAEDVMAAIEYERAGRRRSAIA